MPTLTQQQALKELRAAFGPSAVFREGQWEALDAVVNQKRRLLVVQRTGWGKSAVYFLAAQTLRRTYGGCTLIISPLLALMRNQIDAAARFGLRAIKIDSSDHESQAEALCALNADRLDCLFITPERLANEEFKQRVLVPYLGRFGLLVIDEAHCISDWGHDFRPDYRRLSRVIELLPKNVPVIATTATANNRVIDDIVTQLGNVEIFRGTLERESLALDVWTMGGSLERWVWIDHALQILEGTGLVYTQTIRESNMLAEWLRSRGHAAESYSSEVSTEERLALEDALQENRIKVLITTSALGMGYDKPDLAFVIHLAAPGSIISYYQQVGRAGRALKRAYAFLLHHPNDEKILQYFWKTAFPTKELMADVLRAIEESPIGLTITELQSQINAKAAKIQAALTHLSILTPSPVTRDRNHWVATGHLYNRNQDYIDSIYKMRVLEWEQMLAYIQTEDCKMDFLRRALDDPKSAMCGNCSSCQHGHLIEVSVPREEVNALRDYLRAQLLQLKLPQRVPQKVLLGMGIDTLPKRYAFALSRWMDEGWGNEVADGKHNGRFSDDLVEASARLIGRSSMASIDAVCCITSFRHPELVPDFAKRLANRLSIPFLDAIRKMRNTPQQKSLENSYLQAKNLLNSYEIDDLAVANKTILLVDDAVDSGWTLAVVAEQIMQAGAREVYPFALTTTRNQA